MVNENLTAVLEAARECHRNGRLDDAEAHYREVLTSQPEHPEALHMLGVLAHARGEAEPAVRLVGRAVAADPRASAARHNLAKMLEQLGRNDEAVAHYRATLALVPEHLGAGYSLAANLHRRGDLEPAEAAYRALLEVQPDHLDALVNLGALLEELNLLEQAAEVLSRALAQAPDHMVALNNLGNVLQRQGRPEAAVTCLRRALDAAPDNADVEANLGNALQRQGLTDQAAACYGRVLARRPSPGLRLRAALTLPVISASTEQMAAARARLETALEQMLEAPQAIADPFREVGVTSFYLAYHGLDDRAVQEQLARVLLAACPDLGWTAPHCRGRRRRGRRIRLGFVSHHLRNHTIGKLNRGLIAGLDRDRFEVIVFATHRENDQIAADIGAHADRSVALPQRLGTARARLAEAELDAIYYPDIGMDPFTYFLAFARLAPLQCTTWGHPVTTGIPNMDAFISCAPAESPGAQRHYSERLVRLPVMSVCIRRPELPPRPKHRADFGLDADRHLYICPQSLFKVHPEFDAILAEILRRDPAGELLFVQGSPPSWTELLDRRLRTSLGQAHDRVRFLPRMAGPDFLSLIAACEVMLDTTHFCGGHTTYEALAVGTPVVTLPSPLLRARLSAGMYAQMQIDEPVAADPQSYVETALRLATQPDARAALAARIAERRHLLFDNQQAVRAHEDFFLENCR